MNLRFWRRQDVINPGAGAVLIRDLDAYPVHEQVVDLGGGNTIRLADLLNSLDSGEDIPVQHNPT